MTDRQLLIVEGDPAAALSVFGPEIEVRAVQGLNGEVRDRHVILMGDTEFCEAFAREIHGYAATVHICAGSHPAERKEAFAWAKSVKKPYQPESAPAEGPPPPLADSGSATLSASAGCGPSPAAQVTPTAGVDTRPEEPAPLEPVGRDLGDSRSDWTQDIPPDPQTSAKPPKRARRPRLAAVDGNIALAPDPDPNPLPAALSEDALSEHFIETYGERWRYVPEWLVWLQWRGDGWYRDTRHEVASVFMRVTREALEWKEAGPGPWGPGLTPDGKRKINSKKTAWNARDVAAVDPRISILAEELDADPMILGVPGGAVDLTTGKLLDPDPTQYVTRRTSIAPEDGPTPLFDKVLAKACAEHDGMADYAMRWFGYMLTGDVREEAFIFLYGPGGSGKSTLIKCLTEILHDYATSISMEALMEQKNPRHTQEIAKLAGMRLIYASETAEGRMWNEALIKDLTGRDTVTARFMRGNDFNFKPIGKLLLYGNAMPRLKSVGEEIRRRIHLIEYAGSIAPEDRDTTLKDRLVSEYPAILARMIRGCVDWQDSAGLGKPESVEKSVESYLEGEDSLATFLEECIDRDAASRESSGAVYRRYRNWAGAAGEYVMSQKRFTQSLRSRGFDSARSAAGRMITGLRLRSAVQDERPHWERD